MKLIKSTEDISLEWLETILQSKSRESAHILSGFTIKFELDTPSSHIVFVNLTYNKKSDLPSNLFIKFTSPNLPPETHIFGQREIKFYQEMADFCDKKYLIKPYYSAIDNDRNIFNLVFEDIMGTHYTTDWPLPPKISHCRMAVECLASIHSSWWENPRLEQYIEPLKTVKELDSDSDAFNKVVGDFLEYMGDRLTTDQCEIIKKIYQNQHIINLRKSSKENRTLQHNDSHMWNFMFPKEGEDGIKIIDWQLWTHGHGADDLAYMMALHWYPKKRKVYEKVMLKHYHKALSANGINHYPFDKLCEDYRWGVINKLSSIPIWQWHMKVSASIWYNNLERILMAYEDLNCGELLK